MQQDKNASNKDVKQKIEKQGINLNDYAGDEQDNESARKQSDSYRKDLDRNLNEQMGGDDSTVASRPNEQ